MIALGLDPSITGFGWCIIDSNQVGDRRVVARGRWSTSPKMIWVERYVWLRERIVALLSEHPEVEAVGVESPPFGEQWSEGLYALFAFVNEALWQTRKDVVYFDPGTVKMLTKGDPKLRKGKMFKSDMIEAARADTGIKKWSSDEADAYHIGTFAARFWLLFKGHLTESDLTPAELQSFMRVHTFKRGKCAGQIEKAGVMFKENKRFFQFSLLRGSDGK